MRIESEEGGGEDFVVELMAETEEAAKVAVFDAVTFLRGRVVEKLTGNGSGRTYFVPGAMAATYVASSPGQPPASATGKLRQNINASRVESDGVEVSATVGVDLKVVPYARRLEFGGVHVQEKDQAVRTPNGWFTVKAGTVIKTEKRPYLRPTFDENKAEVERRMQMVLDR
jgi:hypothetical protein